MNTWIKLLVEMPEISDPDLHQFIYKPFHRSGIKATLMITCSDFGVHLASFFFSPQKATEYAQLLPKTYKVKSFLKQFKFTQSWQYTPQQKELDWLKTIEQNTKT